MVVLVRGHGESLEVFWALRGDAVPFMPGFRSFIGGKVDADDERLPLEGAEEGAERVLRACAIREAFEEAGVLVGLEGEAREPASLADAQRRLLAGEASFSDLALEHGWRFRAERLAFAGRWQTPPFATLRFDARYYIAHVPEGQQAHVEPGELASGEWIRPREAIARWKRGEEAFAAPILYTLQALIEGEHDLAARLAAAPEAAGHPARRIELQWGILLHPMKTRPLPPATHTSCYLVGDREMAVVDPGSGDPEDLAALFELIELLEEEDGRVPSIVLLTHHHPDHVGGVAAVARRYQIPVAGHAATGEHVKLDRVLRDGERVLLAGEVGDWSLTAVHTPGHAPGHLCFFQERTGALLCGDHVPGGRGTVIVDPPEGDMAQYVASLEKLLTLGARTLYPSHGSPQGAVERRLRWLIAHRAERERKVLAALRREPGTTGELVERAYDDTPRELWAYAERSLTAHLVKLEREGRAVHETDDRWRSSGG